MYFLAQFNVSPFAFIFCPKNSSKTLPKNGPNLKKIDAENPQIAASTIKAFDQIRHLPQIYREKAKAAFNVLPDRDDLSRDTSEILYKIKAFL